jgi:hypothetical protein
MRPSGVSATLYLNLHKRLLDAECPHNLTVKILRFVHQPFFGEISVFKKLISIGALALPLFLVACNGTTPTTVSDTSTTTTTTTTTAASYAGTYTGTSTGVNSGPSTMVVAVDKSIKGTFTINNRTNDNGVPTIYEATFEGSVDSNGKVTVNSFLEGALVMIFTGQIDANGLLSGTYYEAAHPGDPAKSGVFSLQGPKNGSTTTTTVSGAAKSCTGSYVGNYSPPDHAERIEARNRSLTGRGIPVTGNDAIDNANAGGGDPDGGIWMAGSFSFETDANCNVIKGTTMVFYTYQYDISGTVVKNATSNLTWSGQGSTGQIELTVDANNAIGGSFRHPAPDTFVRGVLSGTFTPNGKI